MLRLRSIACLAALACAAPLAAQGTGERDGDNIVVTGRAEQPTRSEVTAQARAITREGSGLRREPLSLVQDWFCPGISGLTEAGAAAMIDRIRFNADRLDIRLASDGNCRPNLVIMFVDDGRALVNRLHERTPELFKSLNGEDRRALLAHAGPVHAWNVTAIRTRDGMPVPERTSLADPPQVSAAMAHSKIYIPIRSDITASYIVIERNAARGKTLVQLADYATMRSLAQTRPPEQDVAMDTILTLFDDAAAPAEMTGFDTAYLGALYDSIPNLPGIVKLQGVNRQLRLQEAAEGE